MYPRFEEEESIGMAADSLERSKESGEYILTLG